MTQDTDKNAAIQASAAAESAERLRMVQVYVADGPDYVWLVREEGGRLNALQAEWDPQSNVQVAECVSRLISATFNGRAFEFLNSADKAYDAKSRAFYFMIMLKPGGQPIAADSCMERVKVSWLNGKIDDKVDGGKEIVQDNFRHFKLLHKRV